MDRAASTPNAQAMPLRLDHWSKRVTFPERAIAPLGFGAEYWKSDRHLYEGFDHLDARLRALGRKTRKPDVAYRLTCQLLSEVLVAAGGVENSMIRLRAAVAELEAYVSANQLRAMDGVPHSLGHPAATTAWYAFFDLLTWSRTVVERMERPAGDRKRFPKQGLLPALKPKRLIKRCDRLLASLRDGPVGRSRNLSNFVLHTALVRHPHSGVQLDVSGSITLPVPDLPSRQVSHWYLLTWKREQDGLALAEDVWASVQTFVDDLIGAFEKSVPKRLRRPAQVEATTK